MAHTEKDVDALMPEQAPVKPLKKTPEGKAPQEYVVSADEIGAIDPKLPPAGPKRAEELKRRQDNLDAAKAELDAKGNTFAINPEAFEEEREILKHFNRDPFTGGFDVDLANRDEERYAYKGVYIGTPGRTTQQEVIKAQRFGWELLRATTSHKTDSSGRKLLCGEGLDVHPLFNARYVGDIVYMFMPVERYYALQALEDRAKNKLRLAAQATTLRHVQGARPHTELDDPQGYVRNLTQGGAVRMADAATLAAETARGIARDVFHGQVREGNIPGLDVRK